MKFLSRRRFWLILLVAFPVGIYLAFFVILPAIGVSRIYRVPFGDMNPTVVPGDWIFCSELAYRSETPQRGDIVIVTLGGLSRFSDGQRHIKRVLALPGDVLSVGGQEIQLNGKVVSDPEGKPYTLIRGEGSGGTEPLKNHGDSFTVPADSVFVVGDNSQNSLDSRMLGAVPLSSVHGKAVFRVWPFSRMGTVK